MIKKLLLTFFSACIIQSLVAQKTNIWEVVQSPELDWKKYGIKPSTTDFTIFSANLDLFKSKLIHVPNEQVIATHESNSIVEFPLPDGTLESFRLVEAPVMDKKLSEKYPGIQSFAGVGFKHPSLHIRLDVSPFGMNAVIFSSEWGSWYIDHIEGNYFRGTLRSAITTAPDFICNTEVLKQLNTSRAANANQSFLRTYRLAMISGAEFSNFFVTASDTTTTLKKARVLAAQNAHMTRANAVFERDFAIRLVLVPNNDTLIYFDATTDPVSNASSPSNSTLQTAINARIGQTNYDIGHTESLGSNNGNAGCIGCVCASNKGLGWTVYSNPSLLDYFVVDYLTHEFGHQLGANHTFSHSTEGTGVNMEPGSGITIMGYAGITGANTDIAPHSIDHFHCKSIEQVTTYLYTGAGNGCAVAIANGNSIPVANAGADYVIPKSTPFVLSGIGFDSDNEDVLTYSWEQIDNRTTGGTTPVATATTGPMFRTYSPTTNPSRIFPKLNYILDSSNAFKWETLPSVARSLNFRLQVRDNHSSGGGTASDNMLITVNGTAGPFAVSSPNTIVSWTSGSSQTITWSVNNTNIAPVSCSKVKITLSIDGGNTFPYVLSDSTANDGTEVLTLPAVTTTLARIKVEAVGNIFFDISNVNFNITNPNSITPNFNSILAFCSGTTAPVLPTVSLNGIAGTWSPSVVSNTISGIYVFTPNAGQNANTISINITVNPKPNVSVNNAGICPGQSVALTATGANTYAWVSQSAMSDTVGSSITVNPTLNAQYIVIGTNTVSSCKGRDTAFVTINAAPATPVVSTGSIASLYKRFDSTTQFIPDNDSIGILSYPLVFSGLPANAQIIEMRVGFNITHSYVGDLRINLIAPNGQNMSLVAALNNGAGTNTTDNFTNTIISSLGTTALSGFAAPRTGKFAADRRVGAGPKNRIQTTSNWSDLFTNLNGTWRLALADFVNTDTGRLFNWFIEIKYSTPDIISSGSCGPGQVKLNVNYDSTRLIDWYSNAALTNLLQSGHTHYLTPFLTNSTIYYAVARDPNTACQSLNALPILARIDTAFTFNPLIDTLVSCLPAVTLDAGTGYDQYIWNNGSTSNTISANQSGWYQVSVSKGVCTGIDSVMVGLIRSKILNTDTTICSGQSLTLFAEQQTAVPVLYQWLNGTTGLTNTINPTSNLIITLTVSHPDATCVSDSILVQTISNAAIPTPASIVITPIITNICGEKKYRYTSPTLPASANGYLWSFTGLGNNTMIDSGSLQSQKLVLKFNSDAAAIAGDSVKLKYIGACGNSNFKAMKLTNTLLSAPAAPASITIQSVSSNVCGERVYRYIAPALPISTSTAMAAIGWQWNLIGTLGEYAEIDSGSLVSKIVRIKYTSNQAALAGDSIQLWFTSGCGDSKIKSAKLTNTVLNPPLTPTSITITQLSTNVCGLRRYRYTAPVLPLATASNGAATGWDWSMIGVLSGSATIDSGSLQSQKLVLVFSSNAAAGIGDSIRIRYQSNCGYSLNRSIKFSNTFLNSPAAPASILITPLSTNICGARRYRYSAPNLTLATTTAGAATGWNWSWVGVLGAVVTIDSGTVQSQKIVLTFSSNSAAGVGDSIRVRFNSACGFSSNRAVKFSNTLLSPPSAPASIIIQQVLPDSCGYRIYRYIGPAVLPAATTTSGAASGYQWSMPTGLVGITGVIDSGSLTGQRIRIRYSSNAAAGVGDSIKLRYNSGCGLSNPKAQKLSNLLKNCNSGKNYPISLNSSKAMIYPNPGRGKFNVEISVPIDDATSVNLEVYDLNGKKCLIKTCKVQKGKILQTLDFTGFKSGQYWLRYSTNHWEQKLSLMIL
jgi:subtilisin-like proprotein convertase family protein